MSGAPEKLRQTSDLPRDWFIAAIESNGTVTDCLNAVVSELDARRQFVAAISKALSSHASRIAGDSITELGQRIKALENTLRFRLGILRPERPAAWFRAPAAVSSGPFSTTMISEPVFNHYEPAETERVKTALISCWQQGNMKHLPFTDRESCLWRTLLGFRQELTQIVTLAPPFESLRLDELPDGLPPILESRPLRAFLLNVRSEIGATNDRLATCYSELLAASERFWAFQISQHKTNATHGHDSHRTSAHSKTADSQRDRFNPHAENMRAEFRRRRTETQQRPLLTTNDIEALKFMGFEDYPAQEQLRQRYLNMAKVMHPDRPGGNDYSFKQLTKAYSHLTVRLEKRIKSEER